MSEGEECSSASAVVPEGKEGGGFLSIFFFFVSPFPIFGASKNFKLNVPSSFP